MTSTQWMIAIVIAIIVILDVILLVSHGKEETISFTLLRWSQRFPVIAFALGIVFGHIFWPIC